MRQHLRSNVIGYIALFLVLTGGTAYALDGHNTVFSDDIVKGEVHGPDLGANSVSGARVANDSLTGADIDESALTGVVHTNGGGVGCCTLTGKTLRTSKAYDPNDPETFVDLGVLEVRNLNADGFGDRIQVCSLAPATNAVLYTGGVSSDAAETRHFLHYPNVSCQAFDFNGSGGSVAEGDFRLVDPVDGAVVYGAGLGTPAAATVRILALDLRPAS